MRFDVPRLIRRIGSSYAPDDERNLRQLIFGKKFNGMFFIDALRRSASESAGHKRRADALKLFSKRGEKRMKILPLILLLFAAASIVVRAQTEEKRIERLSGLAKIWGAVKYFHPFAAYKDIDLDKALIDAIRKVNAAKTPEEYAAAINSMLAALDDKNTRAEVFTEKPKAENKSATGAAKELFKFENGVLTIDVYAISAAMANAQGQTTDNQMTGKMFESFSQAKAVILDLRFPTDTNDFAFYFADAFLRNALPAMLDKTVVLSATRYRAHNGYESQTGGYSNYGSAMTTTAAKTLEGNNKTKTPPMILLVNENSPNADIDGGLQAAEKAFVVQDGGAAEPLGSAFTTIKLADDVRVKMRTAELVNADGTVELTADRIAVEGAAEIEAGKIIAENKFVSARVKNVSTFTPVINRKEKIYAEMEFPEKQYRLLALFRFWNVINYFFPYKDLIGADWNTILPKYIPQFEADKDALEYRLTTGKMVAEFHDSHGFLRLPPLENPPVFYFPPTVEGYAENQTYIRGVLDENSGFQVGDVVLEVDDEPIAKILERFTVRVAASTPQAAMQQVHGYGIFRGAQNSKAVFRVRGLDGKIRAVETVRNVASSDPRFARFNDRKRKTPVVSILPSGFAYVDLDRLTNAEVDKMLETIKNAPAVIFDMRGYPNGTAWSIAPRLTAKKTPVAALFSRPQPEAVNFNDDTAATYNFAQKFPEWNGEIYTGKVVMLIDENAQSQSEHAALFFETARPDINFIGTPTAGANGDVTATVLPGNIIVFFSGHNVRHADGGQLQRIGIQPTIKVAPTIKGLTGGKDEILDAAVKFLQTAR